MEQGSGLGEIEFTFQHVKSKHSLCQQLCQVTEKFVPAYGASHFYETDIQFPLHPLGSMQVSHLVQKEEQLVDPKP